MKRKIRCDSKLRGLPAEQLVKVDAWLFEEGLTYEEVAGECLREFGLKVSKSSVGRYYERVSASRFAKVQREKQMALEPKLSPSEAYKELLRRITVLAWEEMDQPFEDIDHKVVVRLVRVLIAARREKHMETRVWVERRKVENWLAREVLRQWRRTMKKTAHPSYLPIWGQKTGDGGQSRRAGTRPTIGKGRNQRDADGKPAIQQIENLRYGAAAANGMNPERPGFHLANYAQFGSIKP